MTNKTHDSPIADITEIGQLITGMRAAYMRGENAMQYARKYSSTSINTLTATLISYDLQAGTYIDAVKISPDANMKSCKQIAEILNPYMPECKSLLEVGSGEATTLAGVLKNLDKKPDHALGFDISWSRCYHGAKWLAENDISAKLFVADLFEIPLEDSSVDVVYTSHSLEPNGGREYEAIKELLRVSRLAVVLIEPIFELANVEAQFRMKNHGYVQGLKEAAEKLGAKLKAYQLLDYCSNPLNPSGLLILEKPRVAMYSSVNVLYRCPLSHSPLIKNDMGFFSPSTGLAYPLLNGIPLLRSCNVVIASSFDTSIASV